MSTKTTFKRIALVTVAALGLSLVAVAPSNAAVPGLACTTAAPGFTATACSQNSGANNYVVLTAGSADIYITIAGGSMVGGGSAKVVTTGNPVAIATPTVGTITVTGYAFSAGAQSPTATDTVVITVTDAAAVALAAARTVGTYYDRSVAIIGKNLTSPATDDSGIIAMKGADFNAAAHITVTQYSSVDTSKVMIDGIATKVVTVAVVGGAGYVSYNTTNGTLVGPSASATGKGVSDFYVYPNGNAGTASITVTVNGVLVSTKTVTFYGTESTLTATVNKTVLKAGVSNVGAVTVKAVDSLGNPVPGVSVYMVSDTSATITSGTVTKAAVSPAPAQLVTGADGTITADITTGAVGTASLTFANGATSTTTGYVVTSATAVRVSDVAPTAVVLSFDKDTYLPGEAATITATVTGTAGALPGGFPYTVFTADGITSSLVLTNGGTPLVTTSVTPSGNAGAATFKVNMPLSAGTVTLSATGATGVTVTGTSATVANDSTAADAAAEATDAANAATDAANAAAEAADAATAAAQDAADAVAALSAQVADLIAGLKAQLTALTNLVIKIQKKVKA